MKPILLATILLLSGCQCQSSLESTPIQTPTPSPTLSILKMEDSLSAESLPLALDVTGRILYSCNQCPNKWCKQMACRFGYEITDGSMRASCECTEKK